MNVIILVWLVTIMFLAIFFMLIDTATRGYISTFLATKMAKGKKIFITVKSLNDRYYRTGAVNNQTFINYKDQNNKQQKLDIPKEHKWETMHGFRFIVYNEANNCIENPLYHEVIYDSEKCENLYIRSMKAPDVKTNKDIMKKNIIMLGIAILGVITVFFVFQIYQRTDILYNLLTQILEAIEKLQTTGVVQ